MNATSDSSVVTPVAPADLPILEAGTESIELSPAEALARTMAILGRNMATTAHRRAAPRGLDQICNGASPAATDLDGADPAYPVASGHAMLTSDWLGGSLRCR
jgi:hypothetical protein